MKPSDWIICPDCHQKTRVKVYGDTILENFPLFCPKCKREYRINYKSLKIKIIKEPDAMTQSQ